MTGHLLLELYSRPWAMRPEALADAIALVNREDVTPEMLASSFHFSEKAQEEAIVGGTNRYAVHQRTSTRVDGTSGLYRRGSTAILPVTGPIVRRGGMSLSSGPITSVEMLARDFTRALEDDAFASILLDVDSPGGEASGIDEFARMIFQGRDQKPIWAYVSDLGASAGYWIASAADELILAPASAVGSIGCVMAVRDPTARKSDVIEFVSRQSPNKRPDPLTEGGKAEIQALVDSLGDLFVEAVAAHRGVTTSTVESEFGAGGLKVGKAAVDSGMADRLGSLEGTLSELAQRTKPQPLRKAAAALPVAEPVAATDGERVPLTEAAAESSPVATALRGTGVDMDLLAGLRTLIAQADDTSADLTAATLALNADPPAQAARTPQPLAAAPVADPGSPLLQRAIAAESENRRLRLQMISERATTFTRAQQDSLHALAPEAPHLTALYTILAQDDEQHGPLDLGSGKTATRVTFLENFMASRPSRRDLTSEAIESAGVVVLGDRPGPKRDPNAEPDAARLAALLGQTAQGREVLDTIGKAAALTSGGRAI